MSSRVSEGEGITLALIRGNVNLSRTRAGAVCVARVIAATEQIAAPPVSVYAAASESDWISCQLRCGPLLGPFAMRLFA